jgi:hypothetical protein
MSDPTFNSVTVRQATAASVGDLLTLDSVDGADGNGAALRLVNNSSGGLHLALGRVGARRVDASTVRLELGVAADPSVSASGDTLTLLSLEKGAGAPKLITAAGSALEVGGPAAFAGPLSVAGTLSVGPAAPLPFARLHVSDGAIVPAAGQAENRGIMFPKDPAGGGGDAAWIRYYPRSGEAMTLELGTSNDADDHIALMPSGGVGVGTTAPGFKLDVADRMRVRQGPNGTAGIWFLQSAPNADRAFVGMASDTSVGLWGNTGAGWGLEMDTSSGNVLIRGTLRIPHSGGGQVTFSNARFSNESSLQPNNLKLIMTHIHPSVGITPFAYEFAVGHSSMRFSPTGISTTFRKVFSVNQNGDAFFAGGKTGYVVDHFVNRVGEPLEQGDVVVIGGGRTTRFIGSDNNIPLPEVDLTDQPYDRRVCGIVARVVTAEELPPVEEPLGAAPDDLSVAAEQPYEHPLSEFARPADAAAGRGVVPDGQLGTMVTLGAFAHCKVDADIAPIAAGDLLTTSPTRGHAQKVLDVDRCAGAVVGKALAPLASGKGKIPVLVFMQ